MRKKERKREFLGDRFAQENSVDNSHCSNIDELSCILANVKRCATEQCY
jgi:hypothetical protein